MTSKKKIVLKLYLVTFILKNAVQRQIFLAYPILLKKLLQYVDLMVSDCTRHVREGFQIS